MTIAPPPTPPALDGLLDSLDPEQRAAAILPDGPALIIAPAGVDFDELVVGAADRLGHDAALRARWQARFQHLCVDEFQDVDAAQLRLVRLLAEPERNLFVVGDDDQP